MKFRPGQELGSKAIESLHLASLLCDDNITEEQARQLEAVVLADSEILRFYVQFMTVHCGLHRYAAALGNIDGEDLNLDNGSSDSNAGMNLNDTMVLPAFTLLDEPDPVSETEAITPFTAFQPERVNRFKPSIKWIAAALVPLGILLCFYFVRASHNIIDQQRPTIAENIPGPVVLPPPVAILEFMQAPLWENGYLPPPSGRFIAGQSLALKTGVIQLQLERVGGGRLVIEGPADFDLISSSEVIVRQGNLVAEVPGGGFVVRCPTGVITDLGTEFGVSVRPHGVTDVAVFKGRVATSLAATTPGSVSSDQVLNVGQAATLSQKAIKIDAEGAVPQRFICNLHSDALKSLDVVDLIAGGDGSSNRRGIGVSSVDGQIGTLAPVGARHGDGQYHRVSGFPVVDGAFVPDGSHGPEIVDSAGHSFQFQTNSNHTFNLIWTGGKIPWLDANQFSTRLNGIDYATDGHGVVCLHSNNALTLDLDAVRRIYPGRELAGFHTLFGNSYVTGWNGDAKVATNAGFYVLIDGKSRFQRPRFSHTDGVLSIDVPVTRTDRFLTIASTDAGISTDHDWILMADPKLDLIATK